MGETISIIPGTTTLVEVVKVAGDMAVIRLVKLDHEPLMAVQVGAIQAVEGQEVPVAKIYKDTLKEGMTGTVTWICGATQDHMPQVLLTTRQANSPDLIAIQEGLAVPAASLACDVVRSKYKTALQEAARFNRGSWSDQDMQDDLAQTALATVGLKEGQLSASYFYANHGFSMLFLVVTAGVLIYSMRSPHQEATETTKGNGPIKRVIKYSWKTTWNQFWSITRFWNNDPRNARKPDVSKAETVKEEA